MKAIGIVRRIDDLGRIVVPKEVRNRLEWGPGTPLEMYADNQGVYFAKYRQMCPVTGETDNLVDVDGVKISKELAEKIARRLA